MKLTHERLKQIIKEELQSMQEVDEEQPTLESIKAELYNLHKQLAQDGVNFKYGKVTDPTVAAAELEKHSQTAFKVMKKLEDLLTTRDALAKLQPAP
jgi:hypothetical protein